MRTPLLIAAVAGLASLMPTPNAEACGSSYGDLGPTVLLVSGHAARTDERAAFRQRSFVVLGRSVEAASLRWQPLSVYSYDSTEIAAMNRLAAPMQLTIVGKGGTRTVKSSRQVALRRSWNFEGAQLAVEVDGSFLDRQFAVVGADESTTWIGLTNTSDSGMQRVPGTDATTTLVSASDGPVTVINANGSEIRRIAGYATGAIEWRGSKYVLIVNRGKVTPILI